MTEVNLIHESSLYGIVVETGAGAAITQRLTIVPGGSKTLYYSIIPYSKEYEKKLFGEFERSVSREFVYEAAVAQYHRLSAEERQSVNFILAASSQIASDTSTISHAWFHLMDLRSDNMVTAHFTFPRHTVTPDREYMVNKIGQIGTQLLATIIDLEDIEVLDNRIADIISDATLDLCYINDEMAAAPIKRLEKGEKDFFLAYDRNGMLRFEELLRKSDSFIVNKGSFNPMHRGHIEMMMYGCHIIPGSVPVFLISTYRYDKPHVSWEELKPRIETITSHGYFVVVCKEPLFYSTFKLLRQHAGKDKKFYFTIGSDTLNRIYKTDLEGTVDAEHPEPSPFIARTKVEGMKRIWSEQFKFFVFPRLGEPLVGQASWYDSFVIMVNDYKDDGTSSTKIRNGEIENKI